MVGHGQHDHLNLVSRCSSFPEIEISRIPQSNFTSELSVFCNNVMVDIDPVNFVFAILFSHHFVGFGSYLAHAKNEDFGIARIHHFITRDALFTLESDEGVMPFTINTFSMSIHGCCNDIGHGHRESEDREPVSADPSCFGRDASNDQAKLTVVREGKGGEQGGSHPEFEGYKKSEIPHHFDGKE